MNVREFPFPRCCGTYVITEFGYTAYSPGRPSVNFIRNRLQILINTYRNIAFLVIVLNRTQQRYVEHILLEEGFVLVSEGKNRNHPNTSPLRMYVYANK